MSACASVFRAYAPGERARARGVDRRVAESAPRARRTHTHTRNDRKRTLSRVINGPDRASMEAQPEPLPSCELRAVTVGRGCHGGTPHSEGEGEWQVSIFIAAFPPSSVVLWNLLFPFLFMKILIFRVPPAIESEFHRFTRRSTYDPPPPLPRPLFPRFRSFPPSPSTLRSRVYSRSVHLAHLHNLCMLRNAIRGSAL